MKAPSWYWIFLFGLFSASFPTTPIKATVELDSLAQLVAKGKPDSMQVERMAALALGLYRSFPDSALGYAEQALSISNLIQYPRGIGLSHIRLAQARSRLNQQEEALTSFHQAILQGRTYGDSSLVANALNNLGLFYYRQKQYSEAINYYLQGATALNLAPEFNLLRALHYNLGNTYSKLDQIDEAKTHYFQSLQWYSKLDAPLGPNQAYAFNNLANLNARVEQYDSSEIYYQKALEVFKGNNHQRGINLIHRNLGALYVTNGQAEKAQQYYQSILEDIEQSEDKGTIANQYNNYGTLLFNLEQYPQAIAFYKKGLAALDSLDDWEVRSLLRFNLSETYLQLENYQEAYSQLQYYQYSRDSFINEETLKEATELKELFEAEKREREIAQLTAQNLRYSNYAVIALFLLSGIISFFIVQNQRRKQRHQGELNQILNQQENLLSGAMLRGQEKAQTHIAKELHDNIGMMLSTVNLHFSRLSSKLDSHQEIMDQAKTTLLQAVKEVRSLSHNLYSGTLKHLGLGSALEELASEIEKTGHLNVELNMHGVEELQLPNSVTHSLFRVIQELFTNTIKHAQASNVSIQLTRRKEVLNIIYQDNGQGYKINPANQQLGLGLQSIQSRVTALNGTVNFTSQSNNGSTCSIEIPIIDAPSSWMNAQETI